MRKQLLILICAVLLSGIGYSQTTITGTVRDVVGPLPGATIIVQGTRTGTTTDFDGKYTIDANIDQTLVFSYLGYVTREIPIANQTIIDVILKEDAEALSEVIVTSLGFVEKRDKLSSTYSKIDADKLVQPVENKIIDGIAGKAAGVSISATSGDPGAGSNIQIRGTSSLGGLVNL
ncbi:carboxypeptidase-like regulatory domain-containing protein [Aquimarina sp. MAR_2010_214]|uniref:carboxypeptidase-like regulatory domain-containing protein n=1 Tax=Aquimarina sp. MAR_2010_214 TaxID=1250026 RepID=UPI000C706D66|nr:carboxypeptidase-like regulatory domain-containing protein [Aquimarina sp. MAR_2010_214]